MILQRNVASHVAGGALAIVARWLPRLLIAGTQIPGIERVVSTNSSG
jgi:hypothetical protein